MATLEGVIEHYNEPIQSLQNYSANKINETFGNNYKKPFISKYSEEANQLLFRNSSRRLPLKLALKEDEKKNLVLFLRRSLTEKRFIHLIP
jgi:hypothetical protein